MKIKKGNKFRNTILLIVLLLAGIGLYKAGEYIKHLGDGITAEDRLLQEKLDNLPVLKTDDEIKAALSGSPQDYLVKDYVFSNPQTVKDTVFNLLNGDYVCIYVTEETFTLYRKIRNKADESPYRSMWVERPFCQISAPLKFNDGTEISKPENLTFMFSALRMYKRIPESEVNREKRDNFFQSRYYPQRKMNFSLENFEKEAEEFATKQRNLMKNHGKDTITFDDKRYNFTYMSKNDKVTFAVRLGNGKASLGVFPNKNVIIVDGDRIPSGSQKAISGIVHTVFAYLLMVLGIICAVCAIWMGILYKGK
ncbi:MAG: hypothetical protein J5676_05710 [Bacteroidaceae bacterium]|nr:hypothetical protein [Bacteroidaceae bacterium]